MAASDVCTAAAAGWTPEARYKTSFYSMLGGVGQTLSREGFKPFSTPLHRAAKRARSDLRLEAVGDRPAGVTDSAKLLRAAVSALEMLDLPSRTVASSTDANASVPYSLPALGFGVYRGGNAHRLDEWVEPASLQLGLKALDALVSRL